MTCEPGAVSGTCFAGADCSWPGVFPPPPPPASRELPLRGLILTFVRRLRRYYTPVRLPVVVHHWLASLDFPMRPAVPYVTGNHGISRFSRAVFLCMQRVSDRAGSPCLLPDRGTGCGLPLVGTASAPRTRDLAAQWLACTYPCQRFTPVLTDDRT
jgi:hypothetical protein